MPAPGYAELLRRNADFRRLWLGQVVSFAGQRHPRAARL